MEEYVLAIDAGTTSSRAILFNSIGEIVATAQQEFEQIFPHQGWVEHNPGTIIDTQIAVIKRVVEKAAVDPASIVAIGITNQRETTVLWDSLTGQPVYNAIVWQCRRTTDYCTQLKTLGHENEIFEKTGLVIDPYFSASKIRWIIDNVPDAKWLMEQNRLAFGTIDSWLLYNLTEEKMHATDVSNASRTMLFNIHTCSWDTSLCALFDIPASMLPIVHASAADYGTLRKDILGYYIPITALMGDQQAALFGQMCVDKGDVKMTYGTGGFILANIGSAPIQSKNRLLTTIAWQREGETVYAQEGSVFIAGAAIQWLRDNLGLIDNSAESERFAFEAGEDHGLVFVPSFTGLGAPYWRPDIKGLLYGLTRGTGKREIVRACLEGIAFSTKDVVDAICKDTGIILKSLRVDGGASSNNFLMQFQSDVLRTSIERPKVFETTAAGVAYMAGLHTGFFPSIDRIRGLRKVERVFSPSSGSSSRSTAYSDWCAVIKRLLE